MIKAAILRFFSIFLCFFAPASFAELAEGQVSELNWDSSVISDSWWGRRELKFALSQPTPTKVRYLNDPPRVVIEFLETKIPSPPQEIAQGVGDFESLEVIQDEYSSRLVLQMNTPFLVESVEQIQEEELVLFDFGLASVSKDAYQEKIQGLIYEGRDVEYLVVNDETKAKELPLILIDPGHGGKDSGAVRGGYFEKDIVLRASKVIANALLAKDRYRVALTRTDDVFLTLLERRQMGQRLEADLFISVHADTVLVGDARGTAVYTLAEDATSEIAAKFALFENRVDLFNGKYIKNQNSDLTFLLTQLAQNISLSESKQLADQIQDEWVSINVSEKESRHQDAEFGVLKAPDYPSMLLEIGFMSNADDLKKIRDDEWLGQMASGLTKVIDNWFYPTLSE